MSDRKVYHVVKEDTSWKVKLEGASRSSMNADTKAAAMSKAIELAKNAELGQIKINGQNGRIQEERTYGKDPRSSPG